MTGNLWTGFTLTLVAGLLAGNCMLPMKFARHWPWESTWLIFSITSLVILPWGLALAVVTNLSAVYTALPVSAFIEPVLFGAGWGIAQVLFGLSIARLGMSLGYAIIVGLGALLGTLVPLLVKHVDIAVSARGALLFAGVALMIFGIATAAWAGQKREGAINAGSIKTRYGAALGIAILCGILAPMLNYAFAFGDKIADQAVRLGNSSEAASYAVWPVALLGGFVPNACYAAFLLSRNRTWKSFHGTWYPDVWCGIAMGVLWMGAFAVYGVSSVFLGPLGTSAGWALFQIFMIMTANGSGVLTAEWRGAPRPAKWGLAAGLVLLASATPLIAPRS
jgi:L-rhamnose-H+ transport protein